MGGFGAMTTSDELMTAKDVAAWARVHVLTLYRWCSRGLGPRAVRLGGVLRFRRKDVERWLEEDHVREKRAEKDGQP